MKKIILSILAFFLIFINCEVFAAQGIMKKEISAVASDGFNIKATLSYKKVKAKKEYQTVVLLHSLGYTSEWWQDLSQRLLDDGYAVLTIDFRGHGKSIYNAKLTRVSWKNLKTSAYAKYPGDVLSVIEKVKEENVKTKFFNDWAIVGSDIGANTGVIVADKSKIKPKTVVLLSPTPENKGLYIPVSIAQLSDVDFLAITGSEDYASSNTIDYLRKFAQKEFAYYCSKSKTNGMLLLKNDEGLTQMIEKWIQQYLN